jgi:putative hydrolase of the HAD superfamily
VSRVLPEAATVRTLLLDAGGVLVRPAFGRVAEALGRHGVAVAASRLAAAEGLAKKQLDLPPRPGLATDEERGFVYFNLVLGHAGIALSPATEAALAELKAFHDVHCLWEDVIEGVPEALRRLREAGFRLAVVSNANGTVATLFRRLGLLDAFDAVLDSAVEGVEKPDRRLFELAMTRVGGERASTVHVGDLYEVDVVGGRAAGLRAVLIDADDLYSDADCPRVRSLAELAEHLAPRPAR